MSSKHVLSVCIFCFICATHSPCSSHAYVSESNQQHLYSPKSPYFDDSSAEKPLPFVTENRHKLRKRENNTPSDTNTATNALTNLENHDRNLNGIESPASVQDVKVNENLIKIFKMFGNGESITMDGLERLLDKLQLKPVEITNLMREAHEQPGDNAHALTQTEQTPKCLRKSDLLNHQVGRDTNISTSEFYSSLCPNILYGALVGICPNDDHDHLDHDLAAPVPHTSSSMGVKSSANKTIGGNDVNRTLVWIYSTCAVCVISFCGILGLAVIPIMQKTFYEPLLQFLVALAVGTLAGDALLHLLPHAMTSHSHSHGSNLEPVDHNANTWKGLVAMGGLVLFFVMERVIMFVSKWRKSQQLKNKQPTRLKVIDTEKSTSVTSAADKQCKHKYSSFPYCYDEIKMIDRASLDQPAVHSGANNRQHRLAAGSDDILVVDSHHRCNSFPHIEHNHHSRSHPNMSDCHFQTDQNQHEKSQSNGHSLDMDCNGDNDNVKVHSSRLRCSGADTSDCLEQKEKLVKKDVCDCAEVKRFVDSTDKDKGLNGSVKDMTEEKLLRAFTAHVDGLRRDLIDIDKKSSFEESDMFGYLNLGHAYQSNSRNQNHEHSHHNSQHVNSVRPPMNKSLSAESGEYTVILREHRSEHHGHSHAHGHVHAAPSDLSAVVWMVIMGDGLHNFTDGMAIGAAFSSSITGGLSTTLAVFFHEVPHELGDFAMLLKAGMSMRQALFYNLLSSVLCLAGNAFGVWLGETEEATNWAFAAAAGMFIYIALVDMIPELSAAHEGGGGTLLQCILHTGGLLLGLGIMLLIACYESELKQIFNDI